MIRISKQRLPWHMLPRILVLAWPTMLEQMMQTAVQYIDTAMVGSLGTQATAAVGATSTVNWLVNSTISAVSVGFLAYISQACGSGDKTRVKKASAQAVLTAVVVGVLVTGLTLCVSRYVPVWMQVDPSIRTLAAAYFFILYTPMLFRTASIVFGTLLRAVGDTKTPMLVGFLMNGINVVLNFFLIYPTRIAFGIRIPGADMGVIGAALASAIAFLAGGCVITVCLWRNPMLSPGKLCFRPDWQILRPCLKVAVPNALQRFGTSLGYVAFAAMINSLGDISTAAHTIANTVESAFYIPGYGMQTAAATLAGNALGAGDERRIRDLGRMILAVEVSLMLLSGGLLFWFAPDMMRLFSEDPQVISLGATVLRMVALSEPFYGISIIMEGMLQGMGKTMLPFINNLLGMWGIRILGTFVCIHFLGLGLVAAWGCMIAHNLAVCALFTIYYRSGRWNPLGTVRLHNL